MAEYIEREALLGDIEAAMENQGMGFVVGQTLKRYIKRQPAADVEPVKHGAWRKAVDNDCVMHECSLCGARIAKELYEYENPNRYCYHCGARMDEGADNG